MTKSEIKNLQRQLNFFTTHFLAGIEQLRVDGDKGRATNARIASSKYYLGYVKKDRTGSNRYKIPHNFLHQLGHPKRFRYSNMWRVQRGIARRIVQRKRYHDMLHNAVHATGVGFFDGKPVAKAAIPRLIWARQHGWKGRLVSGWRDPAYSEHLCYVMCGRPACPGTCAGRASNHAWAIPTRFAVDVSDYFTFARVIANSPYSPRIWNNLPRDRVHFSPSGN